MKFSIFIFLILVAGIHSLFPQTTITNGTIPANTVWTLAGSPYIIQDNVSVTTLTIEPGVIILFDDNNFKFEVNDNLQANGFYSDSIYFRPSPTNTTGWQGIKFKTGTSSSSISYCRIEGSTTYGIRTEGNSAPSIRNCRIVNNVGDGIYIKDTPTTIKHCFITNNGQNGIFLESGGLVASNTIITQNSRFGIYSNDSNDTLNLINLTIVEKQNSGIYCETQRVFIKNSIVYGDSIGIIFPDTLQNVTYSDIQQDTLTYPGRGNINVDPLFEDTLTYFLSDQSPCIDEGDSTEIYNDKFFPPSKGSILNDMGAYGGPEANLWFPPIYVKPQIVNFGKVRRDSTEDEDLKIINYRDVAVSVINIGFDPDTPAVFLANKPNFILNPPPDSTDLEISFTPDSVNYFASDLIFHTSNFGTVSIPLFGQGVLPVINLFTSELDFHEVSLGSFSTLDLPFLNSGDDTLHLEFIPPAEEAFSLGQNYLTMNPDSTQDSIQVMFIPDSARLYQDSLIILTDDPENPRLAVMLSGTGLGPYIQLPQENLDFGSVPLASDTVLIFPIANVGNQPLTIVQLSIHDSVSQIFNINDTTFTLPSGNTVYLPIRFAPVDSGRITGQLTIQSNDPFHEFEEIMLSGRGIVPLIRLSYQGVNFGKVAVDSIKELSLTIYNDGEAILILQPDSLHFSGPDSNSFSFALGQSDTSIIPGDSTTLLIRFQPDRIGSFQSEMHILCNDPYQCEETVSLTGEGVVSGLVLSSQSLDFGKIPRTSDTLQVLTFFNTGEATLIIYKDSLVISGPDSNQFILESIGLDITLPPEDSANISINFHPVRVGPLEALLNIHCNDPANPHRTVLLSGLAFDELAANIAYSSTHSSNPFISRKNGNASFTITSQSPVDSAFLYLRKGGSLEFQKQSLTHITNSTWSATIDSAQVTERGIDYYVIAYHGWRSTDYPIMGINRPNCIQVYVPTLNFPTKTKKAIYQMISKPVFSFGQNLNELFSDNLGAYDKSKYRIFDCIDGTDYTEITELIHTLPPGKSIWLITSEPRQLDISNSQSVLSNQDYSLQLHQGWNMISTPFAFPVDWNQISQELPLRYYDGTEWLFVSVMDPFKGYAVNVAYDTVINIPPRQAQSLMAFQKIMFQPQNEEWQIQVLVESGNIRDRFNYAGVRTGASSSIDINDYPEPPQIGKFVSLYFMPNENTGPYSTDYRQPGAEGYIFEIGLSANVNQRKTLKFEPENLPANYNWQIVSEDSKIKYNQQEIQLEADQARFKLFVGTENFLAQATANYQEAPMTFRLDQNYPNPFNPITLIKYQLPQRETVSISIYDILGRRVRTLLEKAQKEPGYYQIRWNGLNDSGNQVASGIYILQLQSKHFRRAIKMILQH